MKPASYPPPRADAARVLVVDSAAGVTGDWTAGKLDAFASPGDLWVINNAATLPASLHGRTHDGREIELRLAEPPDDRGRVLAVLFGPGDFRTPTEVRPPPPVVRQSDTLRLGPLRALVEAVHHETSARLLSVRLSSKSGEWWDALYRWGKPVQYAHHNEVLPLWSVQTGFADRPWAVEMPSAGRPLSAEVIDRLQRKGVRFAPLTHAAGLSATGDPAIDDALPLPERYEIPLATARAIHEARARGRRVVAVGTTVVRALEGHAAKRGRIEAAAGITDFKLSPETRLNVVDTLLTGMHSPGESHYELLGAFARAPILEEATTHAERNGYRSHELGDVMLIGPGLQQAGIQAA